MVRRWLVLVQFKAFVSGTKRSCPKGQSTWPSFAAIVCATPIPFLPSLQPAVSKVGDGFGVANLLVEALLGTLNTAEHARRVERVKTRGDIVIDVRRNGIIVRIRRGRGDIVGNVGSHF